MVKFLWEFVRGSLHNIRDASHFYGSWDITITIWYCVSSFIYSILSVLLTSSCTFTWLQIRWKPFPQYSFGARTLFIFFFFSFSRRVVGLSVSFVWFSHIFCLQTRYNNQSVTLSGPQGSHTLGISSSHHIALRDYVYAVCLVSKYQVVLISTGGCTWTFFPFTSQFSCPFWFDNCS